MKTTLSRGVLALLAFVLLSATAARADVVTLAWDPNPEPTVTGYRLSYGTASGIYTTAVDVGNVVTSSLTLTNGVRYFISVQAYTATGLTSPYSDELAELVGQLPLPLPSPWTASDVGAPTLLGSTSFTAGVFTVNGAGVDIWGTSDQFQFVSQPLVGDGEIVARVVSLGNTDPAARAGVMMREDLTPGAPNVMVHAIASGLLRSTTRATRAGSTVGITNPVTAPLPYWVRLVRAGNLFSAYTSATGTTWVLLTTATVPMTPTVVVGLAVNSLVAGTLTTGVFSNVNVTTAAVLVPPLPPVSVEPRKFP